MASDKKTTESISSDSFIVQDMVPNQLVLQLTDDMKTLRDLRDAIQAHWDIPHWLQCITTYANGELTEWADEPHSTPLTRVLEGLGPDTRIVSLNVLEAV